MQSAAYGLKDGRAMVDLAIEIEPDLAADVQTKQRGECATADTGGTTHLAYRRHRRPGIVQDLAHAIERGHVFHRSRVFEQQLGVAEAWLGPDVDLGPNLEAAAEESEVAPDQSMLRLQLLCDPLRFDLYVKRFF